MTTLYLIRHAQSAANLEGRIQGASDWPLSPLGLRQIEHLALRCRDIRATHIYTSPLTRAKQTALAANRHLGLPMTEMPALREIGLGAWEGETVADIAARWPEQRRIWVDAHDRFCAPEGETMPEVYDRVTAALSQIARRHPDQSVIVVSHGCAIRNMIAWARGGPQWVRDQTWVGNTALSRIDVDEGGRPVLVFQDDLDHLPLCDRGTGDRA